MDIPLPEIKVRQSFDIFDPMNVHGYSDTWIKCSKFLRALPELLGTGLSITESKDNAGKYSIVSPQGLLKDDLNKKQVAALMLLARYRSLLEILAKKNVSVAHEFFNELESIREYHARQLLTLCLSELEYNQEVKRFSIDKLEELDVSIYYMNRDTKLDSYEKVWLVNALIISMARWEIESYGAELYKHDHVQAIVGENVQEMPSHLRILSRVVGTKKESILELYPKSVLMNYSHFYPLELYHTGREPLNYKNPFLAK